MRKGIGARQRAEALAHMARKDGLPWSYFVGLEGGLDVIHESASSVPGLHNAADLPAKGRRRCRAVSISAA